MQKEVNPEFEILGQSAAKFNPKSADTPANPHAGTHEISLKEYPQPEKSFNQSYVGMKLKKSILNNSFSKPFIPKFSQF